MDDTTKNKIRPGGLRYESKSPGTSFVGSGPATMSCLLCGKHRPRAALRRFELAGSVQYRCRGSCSD